MRITYIGSEFFATDKIFKWSPGITFPLFKLMPVDLTVVRSLDELKESLKNDGPPDVFFLESPTWIDFAEEINFITEYDSLIVAYHADIWQTTHWFDLLDRVDLHVGACKSVTRMINREHFRNDNFFFCPHYISPHPSDKPRDIDVLYWGWSGRQYRFRRYIRDKLHEYLDGDMQQEMPNLRRAKLVISDNIYEYAYLDAKVMDEYWYGPNLYGLLQRAKICPTGPVEVYQGRMAVGKYYENMACGAVVMSSPVDDADELGFVHGETIWFTCEEKFYTDLDYLLTHPEVIESISQNAMKLIAERHTPDIRARQLYTKIFCEKSSKKAKLYKGVRNEYK